MSLSVVTTDELRQTEQRIKDDFDSKLRMVIEVVKEGPTMNINDCAERMNCNNATARKRLRNAGIKMNEDVRPMVVETQSFYEALWEGRIKS